MSTTTELRPYEFFVLVDGNLDDNSAEKAIKDVEALVAKFGGNTDKTDAQGRKKNPYLIKDRRESHHFLMNVNATPESISEIRSELAIIDAVLRITVFTPKAAK